MSYARKLCGALFLISLVGCKQHRARYSPGTVEKVRGVSMADVKAAVVSRLDSAKPPSWVTPERWKRVKALYLAFSNVPLWLDADGVMNRGGALLEAIEAAPTHALATDGYPLDSIKFVVNSDNVMKTANAQALRSEERRVGKECRSR